MSHFRKLLVTRGYPIRFLDDHQTSGHLGLITSRFPASAWRKIVALCNDFGVAFGGPNPEETQIKNLQGGPPQL